jgi:hypothetical protein
MIPLHEIKIKITRPTNNYPYTAITETTTTTTSSKLLGIKYSFSATFAVS